MSLLHQLQELVIAFNLPEPDYFAPLPGGEQGLLVYWDEQAAVVEGEVAPLDGWSFIPCKGSDPVSLESAVEALAILLGFVSPAEEAVGATLKAVAQVEAVPWGEAAAELTDQQRAAVHHPGGPARILAGAGTGKTRVIVERFHHLVAEGVKPERILALTFSREAARAMREAILPGLAATSRLWVLTFHAFCLQVLEGEGVTGLRLVKEEEGKALLTAVCEGQDWQYYRGQRVERLVADALALIGQAKDYLLAPEEVAGYAAAQGLPQLADLARAYQRYQEILVAQGAAEFADFIAQAVARLQSDPAVAARWQGRFDHILVDEFQDTNLAQFRVLQLLAEPHRNLMVVGDDDQAIYHFRGATDRFLIDWERYYPEATTYLVAENFRCPAPVLDAANRLIGRNPERIAKALFTTTRSEGYPPIQLWEAPSQRAEAEAIAEEIAQRLREGEARPGEFAILCRSMVRMGDELSLALERRAIPYRLVGTEGEHPLVAETTALLRLTEGGAYSDLLRVMARRLAPADLYRALREERLAPDQALQDWMEAHRGLPIPTLVYEALRFLGHLELSLTPTTADVARLSAVRALQERAAQVTELRMLTGIGDHRQVADDAVTLMTIHAAKGLEFPVVFVTGLGEGFFPVAVESAPVFYTAAAIRHWVDHGRSALPDAGERLLHHIREERRLAYVALTRAQEELILTRARQYGGEPVGPSRFLAEMGAPPAEAVGETEPVSDARAYLIRVAMGAEPGEQERVDGAVRLLQADPAAVPIRLQKEPLPFGRGDSLRLSATALESYATCPRRYYYAQVLRLEEEDSITLAFGSAVHGALDRYHRLLQGGSQPSWGELERLWQESFDPGRCESSGQYAQLHHRGHRFLERYYRWSQGRWRRIREVEGWFERSYTDRQGVAHSLVGRIDLVAELADGSVEIIDFKTGHRRGATVVNKRPTKNSENNPDRKLQLGLYHLAHFGEEVGPQNQVRFIFLRHLEDAFPDDLRADFEEAEQAIGCAHTAESLALIRGRVDGIIDSILANRFERTENTSACTYCSFRHVCEVTPHAWF